MRNKIIATITGLLLAMTSLVGFNVTPAAADVPPTWITPVRTQTYDGVIRACGWQDGEDGWYETYQGSVNCTIQNNHIVVDLYGPGGWPYFQGALDIWYDVNQCGFLSFRNGRTADTPFEVRLQNGYSATAQCAPVGSDITRYFQDGFGNERTSYPYYNGMSSVRQDSGTNLMWYGSGNRANYLTAYTDCEATTQPWYGSIVSRARGTNNNPYGTAQVRIRKNGTYVECAKSSYPTRIELQYSS